MLSLIKLSTSGIGEMHQASTTETLLMPELYKSKFFKVQYLFLTENYNIKGPVVHILKPKWAMGL